MSKAILPRTMNPAQPRRLGASFPGRAFLTMVTALAFTPVATGCSFLFVEGPPPNAEKVPVLHCSTSDGAAGADIVIAGLQALRTIYAMSLDEADYKGSPLSRESDMAIGLGLTTLFASSAYHGVKNVSACKAAMKKRAEVQVVSGGAPIQPPFPPRAFPPPGGGTAPVPPGPAATPTSPPAPAPQPDSGTAADGALDR